jgi:hypothetical protein
LAASRRLEGGEFIMNEHTDKTRAPHTRRIVLTGAAAAAVSSVLASGGAEATVGDPVRQGRTNNAGGARTTLTSGATSSTLRVLNSRSGIALAASSANGAGASISTSNRNNAGLSATNAAGGSGTGAAIRAAGARNHGLAASTNSAARNGLVATNAATTRGLGAAIRANGGRNDGVVAFNSTGLSGVTGISANGVGVGGLGNFGVYGLADTAADFGVVSDGDAWVTGDLFVDGLIINGSLPSQSGTVSLDGSGSTTVEPELHLEHAVPEYDYQLTAIGAPMPDLHVITRRDGSFQIAGGKPGGQVSWQRRAQSPSMMTPAAGSPKVRPDLTVRSERMRSLPANQPN